MKFILQNSADMDEWNGSAISRFFLWCSGARVYLLKRCPTEINVFLGIGIVVFLTGTMAALSGGYAFYTVFNSILFSVVFGLFWGVLIFFLDWYLVSSLQKNRNKLREFGMALPRIVLALFIAVVVARPIEMKLFEREIDLQIHKSGLDQKTQQIDKIKNQFDEIEILQRENDSIQKIMNGLQERKNELYNQIIAEAEGRSVVGVVGKGPVYREKNREYQRALAELASAETRLHPVLEANRVRISELKEQRDELVAANNVVITRANGFLSRLRAMSALQREEASVFWASLFILLLFIAIETAPVFVKLISARGPYDDLIEAERKQLSFDAQKRTQFFVHELDLEESDMNMKKELLLRQNSEVLDQALSEIKDAKLEINKSRINQWKALQLKKNGTTVDGDFPELLDIKNRPESV